MPSGLVKHRDHLNVLGCLAAIAAKHWRSTVAVLANKNLFVQCNVIISMGYALICVNLSHGSPRLHATAYSANMVWRFLPLESFGSFAFFASFFSLVNNFTGIDVMALMQWRDERANWPQDLPARVQNLLQDKMGIAPACTKPLQHAQPQWELALARGHCFRMKLHIMLAEQVLGCGTCVRVHRGAGFGGSSLFVYIGSIISISERSSTIARSLCETCALLDPFDVFKHKFHQRLKRPQNAAAIGSIYMGRGRVFVCCADLGPSLQPWHMNRNQWS